MNGHPVPIILELYLVAPDVDVEGRHRGRELALLDDVDGDVGVGVHGRRAVVRDADLEEVLAPDLVIKGPGSKVARCQNLIPSFP